MTDPKDFADFIRDEQDRLRGRPLTTWEVFVEEAKWWWLRNATWVIVPLAILAALTPIAIATLGALTVK